jgi:hypothetical protein
VTTGPDVDEVRGQLRLVSFALAGGVMLLAAVVGFAGAGAAAEPTALGTPVRLGIVVVAAFLLTGARELTGRLAAVPRGTDPRVAAARLFNAVLAGQGLREVIGIGGGVLGFLTGDVAFMAVLAVVSAFTIVMAVPSRDDVRSHLS